MIVTFAKILTNLIICLMCYVSLDDGEVSPWVLKLSLLFAFIVSVYASMS